ncbi:uncharacterized protein LOC132758352 isoform X2 [Ruditapes philippinarum]|uniref:uncharacterized protein LOC132758352 isoform X2 n=1 Tax=Ruditapes philippinarum TaxID=129788 RepID=UPI00295AC45C|nr:uncharacterized protein LOC132758352 isoform X2 [Ruditapes philippinarum]
MAVLLATAITKDDTLMNELKELINDEPQIEVNEDGTLTSQNDLVPSSSDSEDDEVPKLTGSDPDLASDSESDDSSNDHPANKMEPVDLGTFSAIHPPVSKKNKEKIWNMQYVDLASLYFNKDSSETKTISKNNSGTVTSIHKAAPKQISTIMVWCRAFQIYADIYCMKYPLESPQIFRYMSIVQNLANHTNFWQLYDEKFRQCRAIESIPWGKIHIETYLFCSITQSKQNCRPQHGQRTSGSNSRVPASTLFRNGYCWDFQRFNSCAKSKCSVLHKCANCEDKSHGAGRCRRPVAQRQQLNTPKMSKYPSDKKS